MPQDSGIEPQETKGGAARGLASLKDISGVLGVIETASDGTILGAELPDGDGQKEAALAVFLGAAADQIGEILELGAFERGIETVGTRRMVVMKHGEGYVGLVLTDHASPALVASAASNILHL